MLRPGCFADSYGRMPHGVSPAGFCGLPVEKCLGFCRGLSSAEHFTALPPGALQACLSRGFRWFSWRVPGDVPDAFIGSCGVACRGFTDLFVPRLLVVSPAGSGGVLDTLIGSYGIACRGFTDLSGRLGRVPFRERCGFSGGVLRIFEGVAGPGDGLRVRNYFRGHSPTSMSRMSAPSITSRTAVRTLCSPYSPAAPGLTCSRSYTGS